MHGNTKHGATVGGKKSPEYVSYANMLQRCYDPNHNRWPYYGAKGVRVCERWLGRDGFVNFLTDMGFKPTSRHTIERANVDKNYEPGNCIWATYKQQQRNTTKTVMVYYDGQRVALADLCEKFGIGVDTAKYRIFKKKMSVYDAMHTPVPIQTSWFKPGHDYCGR